MFLLTEVSIIVTIVDVAKRAGVSKTLVSRYLNNQKGVGEESKNKIIKAIKELNYRPSGIARSLVLQKTHTIGVVLDSLCSTFTFKLIAGLEKGAEDFDKDNQYNLIYCGSNGDINKKQRHIRFLTQGRVDGLIIYGSLVSDDSLVADLAQTTFPFALIENDPRHINTNKVGMNNIAGAINATEYLIKLGHKRIAHIAGNRMWRIMSDRAYGYVQALKSNGFVVDEDLLIYPSFNNELAETIINKSTYFDAGYLSMKKLLALGEKRPDAVFFGSDILAFGAIKAIKEAGLTVPDDISLFGFDDEKPTDYFSTENPITTMRQPLFEAGYYGIKSLIACIESNGEKKERIELQMEFVDRGTCISRIEQKK